MQTPFYDADLDAYFYDGEKVPTVTEIIGKVTGKNFDFVKPDVLEKAIERGNAVHDDIEKGKYESKEAKWVRERINRTGTFEKRGTLFISDLWLSGKPDYVQDGIVYDWKTQASPDILSWTLQLSFYAYMVGAKQAKVFHLPKNGSYRIFNIDILPKEKLAEIIFAYKNNEVISSRWLSSEGEKMENNEFSLVVSTREIGKLTTNAKELKALIENKIKDYSADNYSEDNIGDAKKDKADLNRVAKQINDEKIKIKKDFMKPIEEFENTVKETLDVIKKASGAIDDIVKDVENREKQARFENYKAQFESLDFTLIQFNQIFEQSWTNKTTKESDVIKAIDEKVEKIKTEIKLLERLNEAEAMALYLDTLSLEKALELGDRIKENKKKLEEAQALPNPEPKPEPIPESTIEVFTEPVVHEENVLTRTFTVWGTEAQIIALGEFMNSNKIKFRKEV